MTTEAGTQQTEDTFTYHPRTADQLDITPMPDGLGVLIGIYNNRDGGRYTTVDVALPDVGNIIGALVTARGRAQLIANRAADK